VTPSAFDPGASTLGRLLEILEITRSEAGSSPELMDASIALARAAIEEHTQGELRRSILEDTIARSLQEIEQKILELSVLKQIGDVIASAFRQPNLLEQVLEILVRELRAENSSIMLLDDKSGELRVCTGKGIHDQPGAQRESVATLHLGEGIAGWVAASREPLLVNDVSCDVRFTNRAGGPEARGSLLSIPLLGDHRVLGVLNLSTSEPYAFGTHTTRVLRIVANQIAGALVGGELHRELQNFSGRLETEVAQRTQELERRTLDLHRKNDQITDLYFSLERAQKEVEQRNGALVEALTFNDNIVESLHVGIGVVRHDGRIVAWNRAMGTLTRGLLTKERIGQSIEDVPQDVRDKFALGSPLRDVLRSGLPYAARGLVVQVPQGEDIHLNVRHHPFSITGEGEGHVLIVLEDITDNVNLHRQRVKAERLAAITETMVSVNHEVNNPLAVILGYAQILLRRLEPESPSEAFYLRARTELARIEAEALRIREITQKLATLIEPVVTPYPASEGVKMVDLHHSR